LQFESFKPGDIETKEFIAELPITIKMTGNYHALAGFVSDVANLSRLVVIDHIAMTAVREGMQNFDAVVRIFYQKEDEGSTKKKKKQIDKPQRATS
jgi:type IV pilus assembly protein PilO